MKKPLKQKNRKIPNIIILILIYITPNCAENTEKADQPLSTSKEIISYKFKKEHNKSLETDIIGNINFNKISLTIPYGTSRRQLTADYEINGVSITVQGIPQISGQTVNNFSRTVTYEVTAEDGTTEYYYVKVRTEPGDLKEILSYEFSAAENDTLTQDIKGHIGRTEITATAPAGTDVTNLAATFIISGEYAEVNKKKQISGQSKNNFEEPVKYKVYAKDHSAKEFTVTVKITGNDAKEILSYSFKETQNEEIYKDTAGEINDYNKTIKIKVPEKTDVTELKAAFTTTGTTVKIGETEQIPGTTPNDFTSPVKYTVTAADSSTKIYTVTIQYIKLLEYTNNYENKYKINEAEAGTLSGDGKFLYIAAARDAVNTSTGIIAWFARDKSTGKLEYKDRYTGWEIEGANSIEISPDSKYVYITSPQEDTVAWFKRNTTTGALTYTDRYTSTDIEYAAKVKTSSDGRHVYIAASGSDTVAWFNRNPWTGELSFADKYVSSNIDGAGDIEISKDGKHAYIAADNADAVACFKRDSETGALEYYESYTSSKINGVKNIVITSDDKFVYITTYPGNSVAWFKRNAGSGALYNFDHIYSYDINRPTGIALTNKENYLFISSGSADAVSWFKRDKWTGALLYVDQYTNSSKIEGASDVIVSPDDNYIYVTAAFSDSVAWFLRH